MSRPPDTTTTCPYELGDEIPLEDLLAFPPDPRRLGRDERGRLCLVSPENVPNHRIPISLLNRRLVLALDPRLLLVPEGSVALPQLLRLRGDPIPESRLGPRAVEGDLVVFEDPRLARPGFDKSLHVDGVRLVVEVLSRQTWRWDLGLGKADQVDRWRSYLRSGVPELWIFHADMRLPTCPLPPWSGLFLRNSRLASSPGTGGDAWTSLEVEAPGFAACEPFEGLRPLVAGRVRSTTGVVLDVGELMAEARALSAAMAPGGSDSDEAWA